MNTAPGWYEKPLGEVITLQRGFDLPKQKRKQGEVPIVSSSGISGMHEEARVKGPGVVTGRYGTIGQVFYIGEAFWPLNTTLFVKDFKGSDPKFVSYFLRTLDFDSFSDKSSVPGINRNHLHAARVRVPGLAEQQTIASVLGSLDDKIELNRRMNETLEEMARALFKSWFLGFDPVRAKMEGRQPAGMDDETAALFPDSFEGSPLGEIPKGWRAGYLGDIADNLRRGVDPAAISRSTPYIGLDHMPRKSIALSEWGEAGEVGSNKSLFRQGEILFGKLRPYFHKIGVATIDGVCSTDILVVVPRVPLWYGLALSHLSSVELVNHADATSTGTRMPRAKWADLARFEIVVPSEDVAKALTAQIQPLVVAIRSNIHQSRTLAAIRDMLLPKLLSGEVRVREAEGIVEKTV